MKDLTIIEKEVSMLMNHEIVVIRDEQVSINMLDTFEQIGHLHEMYILISFFLISYLNPK